MALDYISTADPSYRSRSARTPPDVEKKARANVDEGSAASSISISISIYILDEQRTIENVRTATFDR